MSRRALVFGTLGAVVILAAAGVIVWSAVSTSSARVAATTGGDAFFAAGEVALSQPDARVDLLFDDDGLYPGRVVSGCVFVSYDGSLPATVRLHGRRTSGNGLDEYIDLQVRLAESCDGDEPTGEVVFDGRLAGLWRTHGAFDRGVDVISSARPGDRMAIWASAEVADDNRAQGLSTTFTLTVEARP